MPSQDQRPPKREGPGSRVRRKDKNRPAQSSRQSTGPSLRPKATRPVQELSVRPLPRPEEGFELVHPRCARNRAEDLEEVYAMLAVGEHEVAIDELRWLLDGCGKFLEAHKLLGEIALEAGDLPLAVGHLRYAYQLGESALPNPDWTGPLPYQQPANQAFFEAGQSLAACLVRQHKLQKAIEVLKKLLALDSSDPLGLGSVLEYLQDPEAAHTAAQPSACSDQPNWDEQPGCRNEPTALVSLSLPQVTSTPQDRCDTGSSQANNPANNPANTSENTSENKSTNKSTHDPENRNNPH